MNSEDIEKAMTIFEMFFSDEETLYKLCSHRELTAHKSVLFILDHIFMHGLSHLDMLDFELYSKSVNTAYQLLKEAQVKSQPIHGNFYNDIRERYFALLESTPKPNPNCPTEDSHLAWMLTELSNDEMSDTKKHRWLGYIQGCMTMKGYLVVNDERNTTRPIFNGK